MIDERILKIVQPYLNSNNEMLYSDFIEIFSSLAEKQQIYVYKVLVKNNIAILDDEASDETSNETEPKTTNEENNESYGEEPFDKDKFDFVNASDEEYAVFYQKTNSPYCFDILIKKHIKFIQKCVRKISSQYNHRLDNEELLQIAKIGFIKGCRHFNINKGTKLLTYVSYWIKQELHREITNQGFLIKLPSHVWDKIRNTSKMKLIAIN